MTVQCVECHRFTLRDHAQMAKLGFGRCNLDSVGRFVSPEFDRQCERFEQADKGTVALRRDWLSKLSEGKKQ